MLFLASTCFILFILSQSTASDNKAECKDSNSLCKEYIQVDGGKYCLPDSEYFQSMKELCPVSCNLCDCRDYDEKCLDYKQSGFCYHPSYWASMKLYCEDTCNLCATSTPEPPPVTVKAGPRFGTCGVRAAGQSRIIGGSRATRGAWPWQVGLYATDEVESFFCGGTLISPFWVLTAAHCLSKEGPVEPYRIRLGDFHRYYKDGTEQYFRSTKVIIHSDYHKPSLFNNDIALIKLNRPAMLNSHVNTACLPSRWGKVEFPGGTHSVLQQARLPMVSNDECKAKLKDTPSSFMTITDNMLCAGNIDEQHHSNSCHGDSGGPFVCENDAGKFELRGVISWGSDTCNFQQENKQYTVFTRVRNYLDWIEVNIGRKF